MKINPLIAFVAVLVITSSVSLYGLKTLQDRDIADDWISHTHTVIAQIDQVTLGMANMETGLRGYLLTGDKSFLTPYENGRDLYETSMQRLSNLTEDNTSQEARWKDAHALTEQWKKDWAERGMQLRQQVDAGSLPLSQLQDFVKANQGQPTLDKVRAEMAAGRQEEDGLLAERIQQGKTANNRANGVVMGGMILSVLLGLSTGWLITRASTRATEQIEVQHMLIEEREKERLQIARDLHDGPVQELSAAAFMVQGLLMEEISAKGLEDLNEIRKAMQNVTTELRGFAMELRSPVLAKFGLEKAIEAHLELFRKSHPEIRVHFEATHEGDLLPDSSRYALFRIYQETMSNIARHARASEVTIQLTKTTGQALLQIQDNGVGFHLPDDWIVLARQGHLGLVGMRERAEALGGTLEVTSEPGRGACTRAVVPLQE